jgi:hypothetical protein
VEARYGQRGKRRTPSVVVRGKQAAIPGVRRRSPAKDLDARADAAFLHRNGDAGHIECTGVA